MSVSRADQCRNELLGPKRNDRLTQAEVESYAEGIYGNAKEFSLFGVPCLEFEAKGLRVPARTLIEATTDTLADASAAYIQQFFANQSHGPVVGVIDPFLGSGNILLHVQKALENDLNPQALVMGVEMDPLVAEFAQDSFQKLGIPISVQCGDYRDVLPSAIGRAFSSQEISGICIVFLAPPWGQGFSFEKGLDLRRTEPSSFDTMRYIDEMFAGTKVTPYYVLQIHENMDETSVEALANERRVLGRMVMSVSPPGTNVGCLVCSERV